MSTTDIELPLVTYAVRVLESTATKPGDLPTLMVAVRDLASTTYSESSPLLVTYAWCVVGSDATSGIGPTPSVNDAATPGGPSEGWPGPRPHPARLRATRQTAKPATGLCSDPAGWPRCELPILPPDEDMTHMH